MLLLSLAAEGHFDLSARPAVVAGQQVQIRLVRLLRLPLPVVRLAEARHAAALHLDAERRCPPQSHVPASIWQLAL